MRAHPADAGDSGPVTPAEVKRLLDSGQIKPALAKAKLLYKSSPSPETEEILVGAYLARIETFDSGMGAEAKALMDLVAARHPSAKARLQEIRPRVEARTGKPELLLRPLADPETPPEKRREIEEFIKREVTDLDSLAGSSTLSKEHPLRKAALAASRAFSAVTSGSVGDDVLLLPEISRRSPLAPWKPLIRSIGCFYRKDDSACAELLDTVDASSAPGRLVPALREMVANHSESASTPQLARRVRGEAEPLRAALEKLDRALAKKNPDQILRAVRESLLQCQGLRPELTERLKQQISVRWFAADFPMSGVEAALRGPSLHDARFWRLMALVLGSEYDPPTACSAWEEFRRHAIHQGWFAAGGPEEAAVYLHMARLLQTMDGENLQDARQHFEAFFPGYGDYYRGQPPAVRAVRPKPGKQDTYFLYPDRLFQKAAGCDPNPETFRKWISWARRGQERGAAERAALAWHDASPQESEPLLYLMESCEQRNALKKALGYLERAEALDGLNPEVKRARVRLLIATAVRHFENRNFRLAEKDIQELESLPQMEMGDRPAFVAALRWLWSEMQGRREASRFLGQAGRLLGSDVAAFLVLEALATTCDGTGTVTRNLEPPPIPEPGALADGLARGCALGDDLGLPVTIPVQWRAPLITDVASDSSTPEPQALRKLAEAALRRRDHELAYVLSGRGLSLGGSTTARFLLLRARSLPPWERERFTDCLEASSALARRVRDMDLVQDIVESGRLVSRPRRGPAYSGNVVDPESAMMSQERIDQVLARERREEMFPERPVFEPVEEELCQCPACRRKRRSSRRDDGQQYELFDDLLDDGAGDAGEGHDLEDFDEVEDVEDLDDLEPAWNEISIPPEFENMPRDVLSAVLEVIIKHGSEKGGLPNLDELRKRDPGLYARLDKAFLRLEARGGLESVNPPPKRRKKGSGKRKKR